MRRHVYFYTFLGCGFSAAADVLSGSPGHWLPPPADADGDADGWLVDLAADGALPATVARLPAVVTVGPAATFADHLLRGVRWRARTAERMFPVLEADLELRQLNGSGCQLSLTGTYRPPLSVVGGVGDRLLGHRVAEACVRRFVLDISTRLGAVMPG